MLKTFILLGFSVLALQVNAELNLIAPTKKVNASYQVPFAFQIADSNGQTISDKDLVETHTKLLHLVVYDASLNEFNHVHPTYNGDKWEIDLNLPVNGSYTVWAQGETSEGEEFSIYQKLIVENGAPEIPVMPLGDEKLGVDGTTQLELDNTVVKAKKNVMINFTISRTDGTVPNLSEYLGAFAHVIATPLAGNELIHVHPMEGKKTEHRNAARQVPECRHISLMDSI